MNTVKKIIETLGGLEALKKTPIRLEVPGYMRLVIEYIGTGPHGHPHVSVAHYYVQNGDLMRDPEITFEIDQADRWFPTSITQDNMGIYRETTFRGKDGTVYNWPTVVKDLTSFSRTWSRNLREQGFLTAAKEQARQHRPE